MTQQMIAIRETSPREVKGPRRCVSIDTPIGLLVIEGHEEAITRIELPAVRTLPVRNTRAKTSASSKALLAGGTLACAVSQLEEYFEGRRSVFDLPLELGGTPFQNRVWATLAEIPYGETVSYAELALMVGRPTAFRAVGQANGANPIPIVLPCHRVVASGGGIGGYGGGLSMKRFLLDLESRDGVRAPAAAETT